MDVLCFLKVLLPVLCFLADSSCGEPRTVRAQSGQDVTLSIQAPNNNITIIQCSRTDLGKDQYVFASRGGTVVIDQQHPSYKGRVHLQMKDGNVSLTVTNVTTADGGTYEVRVFMEDTHSWITSTIYLSVAPPPGPTGGLTEDGGKDDGGKDDGGKEDGGKDDGGKEDGSVGLTVAVPVAAVPVAAVGLVIYRKRKRQSRLSQPPDEEQGSEMRPLQLSRESPPAAAAPNSVLLVIPENDG